jgi:hypothetical protein
MVPTRRASFDVQRGPNGALAIGNPEEVVEKIKRHSIALGGILRVTFLMNAVSTPRQDDARHRYDREACRAGPM